MSQPSSIEIKWNFYFNRVKDREAETKKSDKIWIRFTLFASNLIHNQWHTTIYCCCFFLELVSGLFLVLIKIERKTMLWLTFCCGAIWASEQSMFTFCNQKTIKNDWWHLVCYRCCFVVCFFFYLNIDELTRDANLFHSKDEGPFYFWK